jgi:hypothetical protein
LNSTYLALDKGRGRETKKEREREREKERKKEKAHSQVPRSQSQRHVCSVQCPILAL